ncbi:MAG: HEAT repeat domain-containing protein [Acidobacteriota bacterium]|nr:HEAT repeat domain-containing protein [Acidobacteriota bacterium]
MVKFLRRQPSEESEVPDPLLSELAFPRPLDPEADPRQLAREIAHKLEIIQSRSKKIRLLQAAAESDAAWSTPLLVELLGDPTEEVRDIAVRELITREDCPLDDLCERLTRPPWFSKSAALRILAAKRSRSTARAVRAVVEDTNADVRRSAAVALGEIGGAEARALLVRLAKDKSPYVRAAAVAGLDKVCEFKFI